MRSAARPDTIRPHNLSLALGLIHRDGELTRAELTHQLGLSRSTVGALVGNLTDLGLVEEVVPNGGAGVGRPSHVVVPHHEAPFAIAVDVDLAHVTVAAVGLGGDILAREILVTGDVPPTPEKFADLVGAAIPRVWRAGRPGARPCGVGVSLPGVVHRTTGRLAVAPNLGWSDVALRDILGGVVPDGVCVELGNDADLSLLAEHQRGSARGYDDVVFVMGRVGVGAGVISAGVPVHGRDGYAGEIGHNVLDPQGPPCHCGKRGCIEVYVGENALLALAGRRGPRTDAAVEALFADARAGDETARRAIDAVVEPLGRTVATLLNTLNPARVVLGGSLSEVLALARPALEEAVRRYAFALPDEVSVVGPTLGADSALLGAAEIAFASLLADPR